jgi:hypothetical protein
MLKLCSLCNSVFQIFQCPHRRRQKWRGVLLRAPLRHALRLGLRVQELDCPGSQLPRQRISGFHEVLSLLKTFIHCIHRKHFFRQERICRYVNYRYLFDKFMLLMSELIRAFVKYNLIRLEQTAKFVITELNCTST